MSNFKMIFKMYKEIHLLEKHVIPVMLLKSLVNACRPFVNIYFTAKFVTMLPNGSSFKDLIVYICLALLLNFVFHFLSEFLNSYDNGLSSNLLDRESQKMATRLYKAEYEKLENSEFRDIIHKHEEAGASRWARFSYFIWTTSVFISGMITLIVAIVMIIPLLKIGFKTTGDTFFEKPAFLITLIAVIVAMAVVMLLIAIKMNKSYLAANEKYATLDRLFYSFIDIFRDYKTGKEIRLYKEQDLINSIATEKILTDGEKTLKQISMRTAKTSSIVAILGAVVSFGVYLFIGVKGLYGLFDIGNLVLYCGAFMQIINGVMQIANTLGKLVEILPLAKVYFNIIESKDDKTYGDKELNDDKFTIEFKNVYFKYPGSKNYSLENINLKINNGEHLAVVGRNGSGKTTFIKLMCRLYDVTTGEILINGVNIKDYTKNSITSLYSVVFQDFQMFSIPLCQNVAAVKDYDKERLYNCLEQSDILERVKDLPDREKTYLYKDVEKTGVEISGGEAQKLALARALYKDSPVVILDEPTAALDPLAENEIYSRFNSFTKNKTAIYISHRLSSCVFCDKIAVFDKANLVEYGTHKTLLDNNGKYSELWNAQAVYYN
ncbi:MAG: ABC transporter ATP-binding protein/permease [Acetobacter sp.]|nr:ABC transporter ATP-binding protein/permease [Bacteroides sp.]MCM1340858.1 ABC transporter ATP-binding protein/permease [Acetobacter sp.]MCM1432585.1 ABC transporter ATP-binding protein/permease [Clostridiales bacterium]